MANLFNSVKVKLQKKNKFNLSFATRLTTEFGRLTPFMCEEVLPNDTFKINTVLRCQFAPMKFPVMQKFTAYLHYFFVARRLVMDDWETFITCGEDGVTEIPYPSVALTTDFLDYLENTSELSPDKYFGASSLFDYLGFPTIDANQDMTDLFSDLNPSACHDFDILPFKAYQLVYNEWYRDQTISPEIDIHSEVSGFQNLQMSNAEILELMKLRNRAWKKDYFTSALPDPQRGPDVTLPLVGDMNIAGQGDYTVVLDKAYPAAGGTVKDITAGTYDGQGVPLDYGASGQTPAAGTKMKLTGDQNASNVADHLRVDSDGIRSATINEVRRAFAIQRWYELAARAGNRYIEQILAHFGIRSSDARLQRPQYIGGAVIPVNVGDILQTSETGETPLGTPAGIAQAMGRSKPIKFISEEHGFILGILSIVPEASYPQGMPRKFSRRKTFDFAWPLLANIGEQEIEKRELFNDWGRTPGDQKQGFGYAPRYAEYKFGLGQVHGDFRTSLRDFHDARFFARQPLLNDEFLQVSTNNDGDDGLNRIFAVRDSEMADHLWVNMYNDILVRRVLPKYGTPV